jgi:LmbE family N-acetylglucosaminyl deacetylase
MGTLVCLHAHPDDESIATSGLMARAAAAGHRVVLVVATRGEHGEIVPGVLADGEQLGLRRTAEVHESARRLGVHRVEFLGYIDSGMMGEPTNDDPWSFWQADLDHAGERLAGILRSEQADVLTVYDWHGGYGHPDHIQVHRVGRRAAELAGVDQVFQSSINRDHLMRGFAMMAGATDAAGGPPADLDMPEDLGLPEKDMTHTVTLGPAELDLKRASMLAHRSQMGDDHFMLTMPEPAFAHAFGIEWYMADGEEPEPGSLAAELFEPFSPPTEEPSPTSS